MSEKTNTAEKPPPIKSHSVTCSVCLTEIPESVAMSSEADEYTQHFCGIECYTRWRNKTEKSQTGK
ncbi:MAG TPA: DUF3330 domain-containing protein [Gammaproteobacteria bacterium]|nr:DUF3330 domain-containing protein [Gammaproteobacteria bacterium]